MKRLLILICLLVASSGIVAQSNRWEDRVAAAFYSQISTNGYFDCCEHIGKRRIISVTWKMPEEIFAREGFQIKDYSDQAFDSTAVHALAVRLENEYLRKFSKKTRSKFRKSCYSATIFEFVTEDLTEDILVVRGNIRFSVMFQ